MTRRAYARSWTRSTSWPMIPARPDRSPTVARPPAAAACRYRVLYEITEDAVAIRHIARGGTGSRGTG